MKIYDESKKAKKTRITRRRFLGALLAGGILYLLAPNIYRRWKSFRMNSETFIGTLPDYDKDIAGTIQNGFLELSVPKDYLKGKKILLKPNMVETNTGSIHINTHPMVVRGAVEAFLSWGASEIIVAEGAGHCRDTILLLEESGIAEVLREDNIPFVDLNLDDVTLIPNRGRKTHLKKLIIPKTLQKIDIIVSLAKMKTHHWAGVTLSMKNLFGVMPGSYYGWPKNVLHAQGIHGSILDINATIRPHFAIVDGIVGMQGDGPIMGRPCHAGVLVMGYNFPAVDATCARIMGINPYKIPYLSKSNGWLGPIGEKNIQQRGETLGMVREDFELELKIPSHRGIRL